jgi:hypothetical protein
MLKTNDVGELLPEGMPAAGEVSGRIWSEKNGLEAVKLVRERDAAWRGELAAAVLAEREACATVAKATAEKHGRGSPLSEAKAFGALDVEAAIRARA